MVVVVVDNCVFFHLDNIEHIICEVKLWPESLTQVAGNDMITGNILVFADKYAKKARENTNLVYIRY